MNKLWTEVAYLAASEYVRTNYSPIDIIAHGTLKQEDALLRAFLAGTKWAADSAASWTEEESSHEWERRMIRTRGWIYFKPRKAALWRRIVRAVTDQL